MGQLLFRSRSISSTARFAGVAVFIAAAAGLMVLAVERELARDWNWTADNFATSRARAETIIAALESFKTQHGAYPRELSNLVTGVLTEIPAPTAGLDQWKYTRPEPAEFWLGFASSKDWYPYAAYRSDGGWIIDQ
ncbi:MAG: hypothetical protein IT436_08550 [Phycisphaerales bacterium]|nr:hypothetical protein [Phycisphaerales bacterium]